MANLNHSPSPADIAGLLSRHRVDLSNEKAAQAQIQDILTVHGIAHVREVRLGPSDIVDFLLLPHLAVEVKLRGAGKMDIYRQLERYAAHDRVHGIMLVSNLAMALPERIGGKPAHLVSLGKAWL